MSVIVLYLVKCFLKWWRMIRWQSNRPVVPHELPLQILVCWRLPLTGLHVSPICRSFVMTFLYLTWVPVPHALEHSDHLPYLDQISHNPLSLSSIRRERCIIHMHDIIFVSWYSQFWHYGKCGCSFVFVVLWGEVMDFDIEEKKEENIYH